MGRLFTPLNKDYNSSKHPLRRGLGVFWEPVNSLMRKAILRIEQQANDGLKSFEMFVQRRRSTM